VNRLSLAAYPV